jgi:hypothetical protein
MFFEIGSSVIMAGVAGWAYLKSNGPATNDAEKIQRIFANSGMTIREAGKIKTIRLHRKRPFDGGTEYIFQLPLGMSAQQVMDNRNVLEDGLNVRQKYLEFDPRDLLKIKWDRTALKQIREILTNKKIAKKEIDIGFDGMLKIKVYNRPMEDQIQWTGDMLDPGSWGVVIGYDRAGKAIVHDFDKAKHLLIAGATGYGKSVALKLIVTSLILQQSDHVKLNLIDLKGGSAFHRFKDCRQVERYGRDPEEGETILKEIQEQMDRDFKKVVDQGFEDVKEAGIPDRHFIVIDESADLADHQTAMDIVTDIARRGRSAGYYLIFCTQYPTAQVIPSQTKRNIIARLSYVLDTSIASNVVLDEAGAESLPDIPGRGIYKNLRKTTIQTPFIDNKTIQERIGPHINIRPRKDDGDHGQKDPKTTTDRKYSIEFEKV